jgi:hypothetical protein
MRGEISDVEIAWLFSPTVRRVDNNQASDQLERGTIRMILWRIFQILFIAFLVGGYGILALYSFLAATARLDCRRSSGTQGSPLNWRVKREATTWWEFRLMNAIIEEIEAEVGKGQVA